MTLVQGAFIGLVAALFVTALFLNEARQDTEEWKSKATFEASELMRLKAAYAEREAKLNALSRQVAAQRKRLKEAMKDEKVGEWGNTAVPDAVSSVLKGT